MARKLIKLTNGSDTFKPADGLIDVDYEVHAGDGSDDIRTLDGNDLIHGGAGHDTLNGMSGFDAIPGGSGNDYIVIDSSKAFVAHSLTGHGDDGNDRLIGHLQNDKLYGGAVDDYLWGVAGAGQLNGGVGRDTLIGGSDIQVDTLQGGTGDDTYVLVAFNGNKIVEDSVGRPDTVYLQPSRRPDRRPDGIGIRTTGP